MPSSVSFEAGVSDAIKRKENLAQARHIRNLKARVTTERQRLRSNQQLAQLFLGWICVCLLAWRAGGKFTYGVFKLDGENSTAEATSLNSFGLEETLVFPSNSKGTGIIESELSLIAAGTKREYVVLPEYVIGIYAHKEKLRELQEAKSLSRLSAAPASLSGDRVFLALKMKFLREKSTQNVVEALYELLLGARSQDYRQAVEEFKGIFAGQFQGSDTVSKGLDVDFIFYGASDLGISVGSQTPQSLGNADLRRRLLTVFAGRQAIVPELASTLKASYTSETN